MRICVICGRKKQNTAFHSKRSDCKTCRSAAERKAPSVAEEDCFMQQVPEAKTYVVTYAQNATPVNVKFMQALKVYCRHNNAQLVVIPGRYKNPTSIWSEKMEHDQWWADEVKPYLYKGKFIIGENIVVHADISIQPTAVRPLTGFEVYAGASSAIFGHPKIQLQTIATAKRRYPRIFTTTGAVTKPNYTDSKAGKKGEAHHVFGATIVEQSSNLYHIRQINAKTCGSFIDLDKKYTHEGVMNAGRALALICGDIHEAKSDQAVLNATFGDRGSVCDVLKPKKVVYHDLLDFESRGHHTRDLLVERIERVHGAKLDTVEDEVHRAIKFVDETTPQDTEPVVIVGNHDEHFDRWLQDADPKADPLNARFFHEAWFKVLAEYEKNRKLIPAFEVFYEERGGGRAKFIHRDDVLKIGGVYCNFHGDKGMNGARGTTLSYAKLGVKTVIGHSHSPEIMDGCYKVGVTGNLEMDYNHMPTSWLNTHCVIYANGKRCLIHIVDGEWRAPRRRGSRR